jgi:hypothetical protein
MQLDLEKRREDPDDVFFAARDRRREIKQQKLTAVIGKCCSPVRLEL